MNSANIGKKDFVSLQDSGMVPVRYSLDKSLSPVEAYSALRDYDETGYSFLLESAETEQVSATSSMQDHGRYSFIGFNPSAVIRAGGGEAEIESLRTEDHPLDFAETVEGGEIRGNYDPLDVLREADTEPKLNRLSENSERFEGGLVGFHPYEMVYDVKPVDSEIEDINQSVYVFSDRFLAYDHVEEEAELVFMPTSSMGAAEQYDEIDRSAQEVIEHLSSAQSKIRPTVEILNLTSDDREDYESMVKDVKDHVEEGDIYQGVVSRKKNFNVEGDPLTVYEDLRRRNPSPYMYFLDFEDQGVLGASPETLAKSRGNQIETNPIAGTRKRGSSLVEDKRLEGDLLNDVKERAEHTMLVDLGRNDIKRVSKPGTADIDQFMDVVQYSTVQHIESRISGTLEEGKDRYDGMRSVFPAGTLTGAPKVRSMEIIDEQEPQQRGLYGGAVGYYSMTGDMDSAITIRTMTFGQEDGQFSAGVQAGAGVVADSKPESEFEETNDKMDSVVESLEAVNGGES